MRGGETVLCYELYGVSSTPGTAGTLRGDGKTSNAVWGNGTNLRGSRGFSITRGRVPAGAGAECV